jgi:plasmid replication initiation protein
MSAHSREYPDQPGHRDIDTSIEAASAVAQVSGPVRRMVYHAIGEVGGRGLTSYELADRLRMEHGTVQPRTSELKALGFIRDTGQRRPNKRGRNAIVWVVASNREASK